jgi:predicted CXXCH cytochrome family protein
MCASCHSTDVRKGYDPGGDRFTTTWSEVNVSCQSCHGPGAAHVEWARTRPTGDHGLRVDFRKGGSEREIETCAPCHARRSELTTSHVPGDPLHDDFLPALLTEGLYYADGQQLGEVYEYGSFRQSKMYQAGVRCTDCHDPHSATLRADGNALCVRCHQSAADNARFPTLPAKDYDSPAHHFHEPGSAGARCVSCHMPARNYMVVHSRRDHAIRIPRPDLTVAIGTPNACTGCHADRDAGWASDTVTRWYGPGRSQAPHYGQVIAAGRAGRPDAEVSLTTLAGDTSQPAIVRATALDLLGRYGAESVPASVAATHDPDPAVRTAAVGSLERVPAESRAPLVTPLLGDPVRTVRIEAAHVLSSVPAERLDAGERRAYEAALAEYVAAQDASLDMPGSHLNLAVVLENERKVPAAETEYRAALRLDPDFTPARLNLSRLLNGVGRNADAERVLRDGLVRVPSQGELQYSLGLLLAEEQRLPEAAEALGRAADLLPERARVRYNHALALQQLGRDAEAESAFIRARALDPNDPMIAYALAVLYARTNAWPRAVAVADELAAIAPDDAQVQAFVTDVRTRARRAEHRP